jgi:hypothetical protein
MLFDNKELLNDSDLSKEIDFLFINSRPMSGQFMDFNINKINNIISELKEIGSVVTTAPNNQGVPCTLDYKLSLMGIGNLSIYSKNIISVMTSPIIPCFNVFNVNKFESFIVLENGQSYSHNKRIKNINKLDDVLEYYKK